jgi:hypothetical protein
MRTGNKTGPKKMARLPSVFVLIIVVFLGTYGQSLSDVNVSSPRVIAVIPQTISNVTATCTTRNTSAVLPCSQPSTLQLPISGQGIPELFRYNSSSLYLDHMQKIEGWTGITNNPSVPPALPSNQIYQTAHWIWFEDPGSYNQYQQYVTPLFNWPETAYTQISKWLGLTLGPGSFNGGRRAIYVFTCPIANVCTDTTCCHGFADGANIGIQDQAFRNLPDWPWVVIPHETTNMYTTAGVNGGGWPIDWWADGLSPFPAMVAVNVEKADEASYGVSYWQQHDQNDATGSMGSFYVMFRDKLQGTYGWLLFQKTFAQMLSGNVILSNWQSEFTSPNWYQLHYLKSHVVAYYLSRAAGTDLSTTLNQGTVGSKPPGWTKTFYPYQINLGSVTPVTSIQSPSGTQKGTITLKAAASDPDWGVSDVSFWYSTDDSTFYFIGKVTSGVGGVWSLSWNTAQPIPGLQNQVWIVAVAHDPSGFESPWSVSSPFAVDNTGSADFGFSEDFSNTGCPDLGAAGSSAWHCAPNGWSEVTLASGGYSGYPHYGMEATAVSSTYPRYGNPAAFLDVPGGASGYLQSSYFLMPSQGSLTITVWGHKGSVSLSISVVVQSTNGVIILDTLDPPKADLGSLPLTKTYTLGPSFVGQNIAIRLGCTSNLSTGTICAYDDILVTTETIGQVISDTYSAPATLGFEQTLNVFDNSGAGYMIGHRSGTKVEYTFADSTRVDAITHELTFSDYTNAVVVAGPLANPTTAFYEKNGLAHLKFQFNGDGTWSIVHEPDGVVALHIVPSALNSGDDYFTMQAFRDNGHWVIELWGLGAPGTLASGVYLDMQFTNLSNLSAGSYVIHWRDTNGNGIPDSGDTFTVVFSGT